ncbi:MAG: phenylalanine--tRNA ligase subunit beta [Anaerolineae bacterium]
MEELAERMTLAGLEVGAIEYVGLPGAELEWDRDKVVVGKIVEIKPHPDADRLVLAVVDYGGDELETCVTGAPNLYPYKDQSDLSLKAPFAMEGARLWDAYSDTPKIRKLKKTKIRGVSSRAMVCSERELGLGEDHTGIMLLPDDAPPPGTPLSDYLGDVVLDLDLTPNLARCFSVIGVAREVAALTGGQVRYPSYDVVMEGPPIEGQVEVVIEDPALAPRFTAHLIRDVETRPSPLWMQRRLILAGQRPISNVVDITNYVMLEVGQPLHAFDYDGLLERARRVGGEDAVPRIIVRAARPGEGMESIDHVYREFQPYDILITDTAGPVGIGGVMGGVETEISETTTNILLEAANFNFYHIRRTAQYHKLPSEASARFGRGIHPAQAILGGRRSTEMMRQLGGGVVAQGVIDVYPGQPEPVTVELTLGEVERILGLSLSLEEVRGILESLEFQVETVNHLLRVTMPDHRTDVTLPADLIEEVARVYGYDRIPTTTLSDALPPQRTNLELMIEERMRDLLVRAGLQEIITYRLTTPEREARLLPPDEPPDERPYIALTNPISAERAFMRHSLLNSVLEIAADNARFCERIALYEISKVFIPRMEDEGPLRETKDEGRGADLRDETGLPDEPRRLVIVLAGPREISSWQDEGNGEDMDFYDLKGVVESLLQGLCVETVAFRPVEHPSYHPGRTAELVLNDQPAGVLGQLHPLVCEAYGLTEYPLLAADLDVEVLRAATRLQHAVRAVSRYPAALQDIAVVVDEDVPAAEVQAVIEQAGGWLLRGVRLFDQYRGAQVGAGKKSLAYSLTFQADDRTLTDKDANKLREKIVRQLKKKLGATLRA